MKKMFLSSILILIIISSVAMAEESSTGGVSLTYDITLTTNIEAGVGTYLTIRAPSRVTEEGTALFSKSEYRNRQGIYLTEYYLKSTGNLVVRDSQKHALSVKVTSPEEEKRAQMYSSRLEICLVELKKVAPKVGVLKEDLNNCQTNMTYYKEYVDANLKVPPKIKYIVGEKEFSQTMKELRSGMSYIGVWREYPEYMLFTFIVGVASIIAALSFFKKFRVFPG